MCVPNGICIPIMNKVPGIDKKLQARIMFEDKRKEQIDRQA